MKNDQARPRLNATTDILLSGTFRYSTRNLQDECYHIISSYSWSSPPTFSHLKYDLTPFARNEHFKGGTMLVNRSVIYSFNWLLFTENVSGSWLCSILCVYILLRVCSDDWRKRLTLVISNKAAKWHSRLTYFHLEILCPTLLLLYSNDAYTQQF